MKNILPYQKWTENGQKMDQKVDHKYGPNMEHNGPQIYKVMDKKMDNKLIQIDNKLLKWTKI